MITNLKQLMQSDNFNEKFELVSTELLKVRQQRTIGRKYNFDFNHKFSENLNKENINKQGKELELALEIIKLTRFWNKKYGFSNLDIRLDNDKYFRQFFRQYCNLGKIRDRNYYKNKDTSTVKQMIKGTNDLVLRNVITTETANTYFDYLQKEVNKIITKEMTTDEINK